MVATANSLNRKDGGSRCMDDDAGRVVLNKFIHFSRVQQLLPAIIMGCLIGYNLRGNSITVGSTSRINFATTAGGGVMMHLESERRIAESGWRTIRVFAGDSNAHLQERLKARFNPNQTWFAQAGQDRIISTLLRNKTNGYFIDLAANDAICISNTFGLEYNLNWTGLCMEANPFCWYSLAYYRKCQVVAAVVGGPNRTKVNFVYQRGVGAIVHDKNPDNTNSPDLPSQSKMHFTVSLLEIFQMHHVPHVIDYLSLDVEGAEGLILDNFPFHAYNFSLLTIERPNDTLKALLKNNGYTLLNDAFSEFGETAWAHESVLPTLDRLAFDVSYPKQWNPESPILDPMCA